jgi:hypothetical protein
VAGFKARARTREYTCDFPGLEPDEGSDPLVVSLRINLDFETIDTIPDPFVTTNGRVFANPTPELAAAIAPFVVAWNAVGTDAETGDEVQLPPPAEAGPDVFRAVDPFVQCWVGMQLRALWNDDARKKGPTSSPTTAAPSPSGATPTPDTSPATGQTPAPNRRRRRG